MFFKGGHLEDGARDPRGAEHGGERGGRGGRDPQLLRQQLPGPLQPPGGRGGRGPGAQDARGGGVLGQVRGGAEVMGSTVHPLTDASLDSSAARRTYTRSWNRKYPNSTGARTLSCTPRVSTPTPGCSSRSAGPRTPSSPTSSTTPPS